MNFQDITGATIAERVKNLYKKTSFWLKEVSFQFDKNTKVKIKMSSLGDDKYKLYWRINIEEEFYENFLHVSANDADSAKLRISLIRNLESFDHYFSCLNFNLTLLKTLGFEKVFLKFDDFFEQIENGREVLVEYDKNFLLIGQSPDQWFDIKEYKHAGYKIEYNFSVKEFKKSRNAVADISLKDLLYILENVFNGINKKPYVNLVRKGNAKNVGHAAEMHERFYEIIDDLGRFAMHQDLNKFDEKIKDILTKIKDFYQIEDGYKYVIIL